MRIIRYRETYTFFEYFFLYDIETINYYTAIPKKIPIIRAIKQYIQYM